MRVFFVLMTSGLIYSQGNCHWGFHYGWQKRARTWASDYIFLNPEIGPLPVSRGCIPWRQTITLGHDDTRYTVKYDPPTTTLARRCVGTCDDRYSFCQRDGRQVLNIVVLVSRYDDFSGTWSPKTPENVPVDDDTECKCVRRPLTFEDLFTGYNP